jgi:hypothetical protein
VAVVATCATISLAAKEVTRLDFETAAQIEAVVQANQNNRCEITTTTEVAHSGIQALAFRPTLLGSLCGILPAPKNVEAGVFTLWVFDPIFTTSPTISSHFNLGVGVCGNTRGEDGKAQWFDFTLANGRERGFWYLGQGDTFISTGIRRHPGWTRFDFVVEADGPGKSVVGYIDGREAARKPAPGFRVAEFAVRTLWGAGTILVDNYAFDDDPASLRPAAVQKIMAGDESNSVLLVPGQELELSLRMDKRAATTPKGMVEVELQDAREVSVGTYKQEIDWAALKDATFTMKLPAPPTSRHYWVTARYREGDAAAPGSATVEKINVQLLPDKTLAAFRGKLRFAEPWDWQPAGPDKMDKPPADWANAIKVKNLWFSGWERTLKDHTAGWYRRSVSIPKEWSGRRMSIWIEQPQMWAKVFVNGVAAGEVEWPGGEVDLTGTLKAGEKNELVILVDGLAETALTRAARAIVGDMNLAGQWWAPKDARGLAGEVSLRSMPVGARISSVAIDTSVREKVLRLAFDCVNLPNDARLVVKGAVSKGGKVVKTFSGVPAMIEIPWPDPELWDLWAPNLYDLNAELVAADGKTLDAMPPERFGFREVRFDRNHVTINGNPVNLFMPMPLHTVGNQGLATWMDGVNVNYISNEHLFYYWWGGWPSSTLADDHYDFCDEAGYGSDLGVSDINLRKFLVNQLSAKGANLLDDKNYWTALEGVVRHAVGRYGNRPGLFFLNGGGGGGQLEMGGMFNPLKMDGIWLKRFDDRPVMRDCLAAETKAKALLHAIAPRHRVIAQDAGNFQDAIHITHYAGFMAIQEMIEANSHWLANGVKPYMISEQAAPMPPHDWCDHTRKASGGTRDPIGSIAEKAAITKGDRAFHRQPVDQLELDQFEQRCARIATRNLPDRATTEPPLGPTFAYNRDPALPSIVREVSRERAREQWLNWRADGIGLLNNWGGMASTAELWQPLTGFVVGPQDARTDKTHILVAGETWDRGFLVLNNRRVPATATCSWTAEIDGKEIAADSASVEVPAGGQARVPIAIQMPKTDQDGMGTLKVELKEGGNLLTSESVGFEVLPAQKPVAVKSRVAVVDPENDSADALRRLGLTFQQLNLNADFTDYDIVVFGRRAFNYEAKVLAAPIDLAALTAAGKKILVLEQDESTLRQRFLLRTDYLSPRNTFGRTDAGHPALKGLPDRLLAYWRGSATLTDGYEIARSQAMNAEHNGSRWFYLWNDGQEHPRPIKWGNRHNVATVVVMKPERGNFRTLVDSEYGLNYAAVWEIEQGPGRMLFSQMDVSGRTEADPAASRLLANLLTYLDGVPAPAWVPGVAYLGGPQGADLLEKLGVAFRPAKQPADLRKGEAIIVGDIDAAELATWKDAIAAQVADGATCLSLPKPTDGFSWLPFPVATKAETIDAVPVMNASLPLLAGLSDGDLYFKGRIPLAVISDAPRGSALLPPGILADVSHGKGRYVLCQIWPDSFDTKTRFYLEESQKLNYRFIQNLLNNIDIQMATPGFLKAMPKAAAAGAAPLDLAGAKWSGLKAKPGETATPAASDPRWKTVKLPGYVNDQLPEWKDENTALFWYRCEFDVPKIAGEATVFIGAIKDEDDTFLNGTPIGHTGRDTNANDWLLAPRYYPVPAGALKEGRNELLVKVICLSGKSGVTAGPTRILWGAGTTGEAAAAQLASLPPIDLAGSWRGAKGTPDEKDVPADGDPRWHPIRVPGEFQGQHGDWAAYNGLFWYTRTFDLKAIPEGARPVLVVGAIDDEDDTYLNGHKIGHTGVDTNPKNYWMAPRLYPIPPGVLKPGSNTIVVRNNDLRGSGGITVAPVQITWIHPAEAAKARLAASPYLFPVARADDPYWYNGW